MPDRIRSLRVENLRTLRDVELPLRGANGLTVLIGENGSGKSSLIEAAELLRCVGDGSFESAFTEVHGGPDLLARRGASVMALTVDVEATMTAPALRYRLEFAVDRFRHEIQRETLDRLTGVGAERRLLERTYKTVSLAREGGALSDQGHRPNDARRPLLSELTELSQVDPDILRAKRALAAIEVHTGFDVSPRWVARRAGSRATMRERTTIDAQTRLHLMGANLSSAYFTLRNERSREAWEDVLDWVRLGLGHHVEDVRTPSAGAGQTELELLLRGVPGPVRAASLSNGTLAWLALVAMAKLDEEPRSLLAFDEPDLHLHPLLLTRAVQLFQSTARSWPVLLATHSRRVLDALGADAADATVVCELVPTDSSTRLRRIDPDALALWLEDYDGLGQVLDRAGEAAVLSPEPAPTDDADVQAHAP